MLNNPIFWADPDGSTEFYFGGVWIGTDGVNNGLIGKVYNKDIADEIMKKTKKGLNYTPHSTDKAAAYVNKILLVQREVLSASLEILKLALTEKGKDGEFTQGMKKNKDNDCFEVLGSPKYTKGDSGGEIPEGSEVGIHSHPTGIDSDGKYSFANKPSMIVDFGEKCDEFAFKHMETNIIVGNLGIVETHVNSETKKVEYVDNRNPSIVFLNSNSKLIGEINQILAEDMLNGVRGEAGQKFDKKQIKNEGKMKIEK